VTLRAAVGFYVFKIVIKVLKSMFFMFFCAS